MSCKIASITVFWFLSIAFCNGTASIFDDCTTIVNLCHQIIREQERDDSAYSIQLYSQLFLVEACRELILKGLVAPGAPQHAMERIRIHLEEMFLNISTLDDLCADMGLSKSYLCREFKTYTGKTIIEYINQKKIERSMLLLRTCDEKIISIAHQSGFTNLSHFNRTFQRIVGHSPKKYRGL